MKLDRKYRYTPYTAPPPDGYEYVWPEEKIEVTPGSDWVQIGGGGDGTEFRIRLSDPGSTVYIYFPINDETQVIANDIEDLVRIWKKGQDEYVTQW